MKTEEAKITSKGQVTIPKKIRELFGLETGKKIVFIVEKNEIIMIPKPKDPLKQLLKLRKEIKFTQNEIEDMMKESKMEWSKFQ